ncbi:DUF1127 domain-containing protein [Pseudomonas tolaasii]|uniref:DUF1127 domain-containing protein n=3 Tax=Pseudomonas tolaasii TaxID=29442 RepID=A0A7Y8ATQ5_PSETO|nr:hypothetical protein B5P22_29405 [Pseudomonas tolaasii]PKA78894.1 uncharacterized protein YjiS (DUF1127 family) [Pseudomonas tolaasii NCPPB 2192]KAB0470383.1 DUF1127 domain-containing protein [Pseudomonas tolaasii]MBY8943087.1 DUF1127 domain-containing protein [Pseudomonas tolaasii]NVZ45187.1 DUF1127 domain-containing protein [Pseudomonas tolaasii]
MYCIRNIRWIDHKPRHTLASSPLEGEKMKGQKGFVLMTKRPFSGLFHTLARWQTLHHERQLLASLSDEALKDIGLNRGDVEQERHLHFWQDPLRK